MKKSEESEEVVDNKKVATEKFSAELLQEEAHKKHSGDLDRLEAVGNIRKETLEAWRKHFEIRQ